VGGSFTGSDTIYYDILQADGSPLPAWSKFDRSSITFDGFSPGVSASSPLIISLALHASDQEGYTAFALPFDLIIATKELSITTPSLPTINITASTPFNITLSSPDDFSGVLVNGTYIQPSDIASLDIDVSQYSNWLKYDQPNRMLMGEPPNDLRGSSQFLPVTLTTTFDQTIHTNVSLAVVASYFSSQDLTPVSVGEDGQVDFNLEQYFSNATSGQQPGDVNLTIAFDPKEVNNYFSFDPATAQMKAKNLLPGSISGVTHIAVTFTAYSHTTHSTSHASLTVNLLSSDYKKRLGRPHLSNLSESAHKKLVLGLTIAFGVMGSILLAGILLSAFRRCARVDDTVIGGEEGRNAWSTNDRKWYGIDAGGREAGQRGRYGWTDKGGGNGRNAMEIDNQFQTGLAIPFPAQTDQRKYGGLQRVLSRTNSQSRHSPGSQAPRSAVMSKAEFLGKIKETVRNVSDKYKWAMAGPKRPVIGKPVLVMPVGGILSVKEALPFDNTSVFEPPSNLDDNFDDAGLQNYAASYLTDSPSSSTEGKSIPRRRADFAPPSPIGPREPASVQFKDSPSVQQYHGAIQHGPKLSAGSTDSLASDSSTRTHATEAVVQTAARATSVRSVRSTADFHVPLVVGGAPPRLVPFTSAARVPVPRVSSASFSEGDEQTQSKRVASQSAAIFKDGSAEEEKGTMDDLRVGMHYVRTLGGDQQTAVDGNSAVFYTNPSTPTVSTNVRSSFSSLESSHHGHGSVRDSEGNIVSRMLVRTSEKFKFRIPASIDSSSHKKVQLDVRLISGHPLPNFLEANVKGSGKYKRAVEFLGTPTVRDIGEISVGVYMRDGECVARVVIEVVGRS
jgi:axial budding pattern protein 2